jgi:Ala-tRNA(Pro) deacylase
VLDAEMMGAEMVNFHPLKNDATTAIRPDDLRRFVADCGHEPIELDLTPFERPGEAETPE